MVGAGPVSRGSRCSLRRQLWRPVCTVLLRPAFVGMEKLRPEIVTDPTTRLLFLVPCGLAGDGRLRTDVDRCNVHARGRVDAHVWIRGPADDAARIWRFPGTWWNRCACGRHSASHGVLADRLLVPRAAFDRRRGGEVQRCLSAARRGAPSHGHPRSDTARENRSSSRIATPGDAPKVRLRSGR